MIPRQERARKGKEQGRWMETGLLRRCVMALVLFELERLCPREPGGDWLIWGSLGKAVNEEARPGWEVWIHW